MSGIELHPRYQITKRFELALREAIGKVIEAHAVDHLTPLEVARVLNTVLGSETGHWLNYCLRDERHPDDPEKKADEA